jgi:SagB-type dehydrogenase family enzyme
MSKLAWVLLPLLLASAWVAVLALRRRLPTRMALNVWFSVLLLIYLGATAGLGIFWVANQHLPVFDWHYLFGYATVLLLLVHLAFNFRVVWRHFSRPAAPTAPDAARRSAVGGVTLAGVLAAGGAGYWLGLRHGRTELTVAASGAAGNTAANEVVERFHAFSMHTRGGVLRRAAGAGWGDAPPSFKDHGAAQGVALPRSATPSNTFDLATLGTVLWHTAGVSQERGTISFRTSPSSGALFATELYVYAAAVLGLAAGWWHHDARAHRLVKVSDAPWPWAHAGAMPPAFIVATAVFARSGHKYRDRTYRYVLADLGHALENLRATSQALGWVSGFWRAFDESALAAALGLNEDEQGVLAVAAVHAPSQPPPTVAGPWQAAAVAIDADTPVSVTQAIHRATSLRLGQSPAAAVLQPAIKQVEGAVFALPTPRALKASVLDVIASRRSDRRFADRPLTLQVLSTVLHAMQREQAAVFSDAVRIDLVSHAVQGLPPGSWRYEPSQHALIERRHAVDAAALRNQSRRAALDQDVIGDAAVVLVLAIDRDAWQADPLGAARGYRHAFLEAGVVGERLYLAAGALGDAFGCGVCAVGAFYDAEASELVAVDSQREWVVHFAGLGAL